MFVTQHAAVSVFYAHDAKLCQYITLSSKSNLKAPQHGRISHPFICSIALGSSAEQLLNNIQAIIASSPDQAGATLQHLNRVCGQKLSSLVTSAGGTVIVIVIDSCAKCLSPIAIELDWKPTCLHQDCTCCNIVWDKRWRNCQLKRQRHVVC